MFMQFFQKLFSFLPWGKKVSSRTDAKNRLKLVIAHDRTGLGPEMVERMRQEILEVVARYVEIDPNDSDFSLDNNNRETTLVANLPIRRVRNRLPEEEIVSPGETTTVEEKPEKPPEDPKEEKEDQVSEEIPDSDDTPEEKPETPEA